MKLLLDTHLLIWAASEPENLSDKANSFIADPANELFFSVVNIWEIAIKYRLGKLNVSATPGIFREECLAAGYKELTIIGEHALAVTYLPLIHKDPFDRMLIAQARSENMQLLSSDSKVAGYKDSIVLV